MSPPPPFPFYAKAKFSYKGTYPEDLVFRKGAVVLVLSVVAEGEWWKARALADNGTEMGDPEEGNVPMGYFTILEDYEPPPAPSPPSMVASCPPPVPLASRPSLVAPASSAERSTAAPSPSTHASRPSWKDRQPTTDSASPVNAPSSSHLSHTTNSTPSRNWTPPSRARPAPADSTKSAVPSDLSASRSTSSSRPAEPDEDEPVFVSLKDRMAALNGRGLSVSGAASSATSARPAITPRTSINARLPMPASLPAPTASGPISGAEALSATPSPTPPPLKPRPKMAASAASSSSIRPGSSSSVDIVMDDPSPAPLAPPRLPPRLPPRRPSSNASIQPAADDDDTARPPPPFARRLPPPAPARSNTATSSSSLSTPALPARIPSPAQGPTLATPTNPPPPPRRQPNLPPPSAIPKPPPRPTSPPPLTSSSFYPHPNAQPLSDADLELHTQWYCTQPLSLPSSILAKRNCRPIASAQFASSSRDESWLKLGLMYGDRSRSFITLSWGAGTPASSPRVVQSHTDPPRRRTAEELDEAAVCYGERIARWCEEREGTVVGRGECWDLPDQAIKGVSEDLKEETRGEHAGLAEAVEHSFGEVVYVNVEGNVGWGVEGRSGVRRGDVLQFVYATFKSYYSDGSSSTSTAGTPTVGHSAVVIEDWNGGVGGTSIKVLQSNVGGSKAVQRGEFSLSDLVSGEVRAFRVMEEEEWGGGDARVEP